VHGGRMMRAALFAHGVWQWDRDAQWAWDHTDLRIAVNGGLRPLLEQDLHPDLVVGDLDSLPPEALRWLRLEGVPILQYPTEKDATDLELALLEARRRGAREVYIFGALGGRWDQTLANLLLIAHPELQELQFIYFDQGQRLFPIRGHAVIRGQIGDLISFLPLGGPAHGVTLQGFRYPLEDGTLPWGTSLGVSNEFVRPEGVVRVRDGYLLAVHIPRHIHSRLEQAKTRSAEEAADDDPN